MKRILKSTISVFIICISFVELYSQTNKDYTFEEMKFNTTLSEVATYYKDGQLYVYRNKPFYKFYSKYYDLYTISVDKEKDLARFERLSDDINTRFNEGPVTFDEKNNLVYVTRNRYSNQEMKDNKLPENPLEIDIYKENNGQFTFKEKFVYNDSTYSVAHACYSEITNRLYFTSNKPGGQGGTDIYYCEIKRDGSYGKPINLGKKVNTKKEEKFTVVKDGVLYFSSDGHHRRKDLDIYYITELGLTNGEKPKNLGEPFNSNWDDFGIALINSYSGYLSSNRGHDQEYNHDIYYFDIGKPIMKDDEFNLLLTAEKRKREMLTLENFKVYDIDTKAEMPKTLVDNGLIIEKMQENHYYEIYFDDTLNLENVKIGPYSKASISDVFLRDTLMTNVILASVDLKKDSVILAKLDTNLKVDTLVAAVDTNLVAQNNDNKTDDNKDDVKNDNIKIDDIKQNDYKTIDPNTNVGIVEVKLIQTSDIYFDFDKSELKPEAKKELDKVVKFLSVNGQVKLKVWAHADSRGPEPYNQVLSNKRAETVYNYLVENGLNKSQVIEYKGFGENKPIYKCDENTPCSNAQHRKNRRVEFILVR